MAVVVLVILTMQWLKGTTNHGEFVEVPDFSKMSVSEMRKAVEEAGLRYQVLDSSNYNPDYPRFSILDQNPPAGNKVKANLLEMMVRHRILKKPEPPQWEVCSF